VQAGGRRGDGLARLAAQRPEIGEHAFEDLCCRSRFFVTTIS